MMHSTPILHWDGLHFDTLPPPLKLGTHSVFLPEAWVEAKIGERPYLHNELPPDRFNESDGIYGTCGPGIGGAGLLPVRRGEPDAPTFAAVSMLVFVVTLMACYDSARWAAWANPIAALRQE
jgi:hypothetical protein